VNTQSANRNFPHLHHYTCPLNYLFVVSPVPAAQLIVALLEIEIIAEWFLA
jgi:hypothetical protein